jgi:mono/diheme cytochrome c family protein
MIKKWLPFIFLMVVLIISMAYLFLSPDQSEYTPQSDNPAIIYREACMHCHGDQGQGSGLLYPAFDKDLTEGHIQATITEGDLLMPAFPGIKGDTLKQLVHFIHSGAYKK